MTTATTSTIMATVITAMMIRIVTEGLPPPTSITKVMHVGVYYVIYKIAIPIITLLVVTVTYTRDELAPNPAAVLARNFIEY